MSMPENDISDVVCLVLKFEDMNKGTPKKILDKLDKYFGKKEQSYNPRKQESGEYSKSFYGDEVKVRLGNFQPCCRAWGLGLVGNPRGRAIAQRGALVVSYARYISIIYFLRKIITL
ncbi:hypothetical protein JTB14_009849 [Gonioctena quinquepunctata]|nr:hypothetical protein JTB14_009849 [Gonioctena quinquepunctata]